MKKLLTMMLVGIFVSSIAMANTETYQAVQDTTLMKTVPGTCQQSYYYPYIEFDGIDRSATVTDAKLRLYNLGDYGDENFIAYYVAHGINMDLDNMFLILQSLIL